MKIVNLQLSEPEFMGFRNAPNFRNSLILRIRIQTEKKVAKARKDDQAYKGWQYGNKLEQIGAQTQYGQGFPFWKLRHLQQIIDILQSPLIIVQTMKKRQQPVTISQQNAV